MIAKSEIVSILITFTVGFFAGGYLYINHFTKMISPDQVADVSEVELLTIESEAYGGCRSDCPAFQVKNDGTYRYRYAPAVGADAVFVSGTLPRSIQRDLGDALTARDLSRQTREINPVDCPSFVDGIDIEYIITLSGEEYVLDSCGTAVDFQSASWQALAKIWNYFETL